MAWRRQATNHYLNQCWPSFLTHICGTRGRWVLTNCNTGVCLTDYIAFWTHENSWSCEEPLFLFVNSCNDLCHLTNKVSGDCKCIILAPWSYFTYQKLSYTVRLTRCHFRILILKLGFSWEFTRCLISFKICILARGLPRFVNKKNILKCKIPPKGASEHTAWMTDLIRQQTNKPFIIQFMRMALANYTLTHWIKL